MVQSQWLTYRGHALCSSSLRTGKQGWGRSGRSCCHWLAGLSLGRHQNRMKVWTGPQGLYHVASRYSLAPHHFCLQPPTVTFLLCFLFPWWQKARSPTCTTIIWAWRAEQPCQGYMGWKRRWWQHCSLNWRQTDPATLFMSKFTHTGIRVFSSLPCLQAPHHGTLCSICTRAFLLYLFVLMRTNFIP